MIARAAGLGKRHARCGMRHGRVTFGVYIGPIVGRRGAYGHAYRAAGMGKPELRVVRDGGFRPRVAEKTILVLSVPSGAGHTRVAQAIQAGAGAEAHAIHLDAMAFATPRLRTVYTDLYLLLIRRAPGLWRHVYHYTDRAAHDGWTNRLRRWVERRDSAPLLARIAALRPDIIVCTHFMPAELLSRQIAAGQLACPVWIQVTDFDLHRMWVHPHIAGYFAPSDEVAFRMRRQGIAAEAIHVTGIPVMPAFARPPGRAACARALGIDPARTTLLLMGGGAGLGGLSTVAQRLLDLPGNVQLIVLAGNNAAELQALHALAAQHPGRLVAQGYTNQVERLMACADLAITKPGGSTVAECLAMGLPLLVNATLPGQEEHNANFLLEQGAALKACDLATLEYRVRYLLAHPSKLAEMAARAAALGRPHAATQVIETLLKPHESADGHP
jgi:processive 1,2-diacylglycerol beta-glucosyltransferase